MRRILWYAVAHYEKSFGGHRWCCGIRALFAAFWKGSVFDTGNDFNHAAFDTDAEKGGDYQ